MTNYEKYKDVFIELLATNFVGTCSRIYGLRTNKETCPLCSDHEVCEECERLNKEWLEAEDLVFDLEELEAGDKILMRKLGEKDAWLYEVVCNSFPALWLRFRASENCVSQARDENFLIFYADLSDKYEVHEVIKND